MHDPDNVKADYVEGGAGHRVRHNGMHIRHKGCQGRRLHYEHDSGGTTSIVFCVVSRRGTPMAVPWPTWRPLIANQLT